MHRVTRSALLSYSARQMYDLVNEVEYYPRFLPWCYEAEVHERTEIYQRATLGMAVRPLRKHFTTVNSMRPGERIDMRLENGPFRDLLGVWLFESLGDNGTKVSVDVSFEFSSRVLDFSLGSRLENLFGGLIDAFRDRAKQVYGAG